MNFELSEELKMLREMTYKFAVAEFTPHIRECDEHEKYTPEIRRKAAGGHGVPVDGSGGRHRSSPGVIDGARRRGAPMRSREEPRPEAQQHGTQLHFQCSPDLHEVPTGTPSHSI